MRRFPVRLSRLARASQRASAIGNAAKRSSGSDKSAHIGKKFARKARRNPAEERVPRRASPECGGDGPVRHFHTVDDAHFLAQRPQHVAAAAGAKEVDERVGECSTDRPLADRATIAATYASS